MNRPLRVLISAFACNPYRGSEEGVGWGWAHAAARRHEVHVITAAFQRADIERWYAQEGRHAPRLHFHYVPERRWHYRPSARWRRVEDSLLKPLMNLAYAGWLREAGRLARRLHARHRFDLLHVLTYVGFRFPGRYWRLPIPLVWGPIGGLEDVPWRVLPWLGAAGALFFAGRNLVNGLHKRLLVGPRRAMRRAAVVIAATSGMQREIWRWYRRQSEVICEVGCAPLPEAAPALRRQGEPLRIAWSGKHLPGKALPLLLHALAVLPPELDWQLVVLGAGPCTGRWRALAGRLGLEPRCEWTGWLERQQALARLRQCHVFAITSLHELTSTVLVEALSAGLPVVCPDAYGFRDAVSPACGIRYPVGQAGETIGRLARALAQLGADEALRRRLALGALERSRAFCWERKARALEAVYARALGKGGAAAAAGARGAGREFEATACMPGA
ncbi:MAG: hypothetical protein KatS3mg102_2660 [Planctomycetota bacterium]|nr:MAG: hypothetical protein KatS3mg102_2660 [Planctomycetota bacterium]